MKYFCPFCWHEMPSPNGACPHCQKNVEVLTNQLDYSDKLVLALRHPEPQTAKRAAWILGERRDPKAISPLLHALKESNDIYFIAAVVEALGKIGDPSVLEVLQYHSVHGAIPVRSSAQRAVKRLKRKAEHA